MSLLVMIRIGPHDKRKQRWSHEKGETCRKTESMLILCDADYAMKEQYDGKVA